MGKVVAVLCLPLRKRIEKGVAGTRHEEAPLRFTGAPTNPYMPAERGKTKSQYFSRRLALRCRNPTGRQLLWMKDVHKKRQLD